MDMWRSGAIARAYWIGRLERLGVFTFLVGFAFPSTPASQPVLFDRTLMDTIVTLARTSAVNRAEIDWQALSSKLEDLYQTGGVVIATQYILQALHDDHGRIWVDQQPYYGLEKPWQPSTMVIDSTLLKQYRQSEMPVYGVRIEPSYGYIRIPSIIFGPDDHIHAHQILNTLTDIAADGAIKGWIIDLRWNGGGTMFPMLAGLSPLFGSESLGSFTDPATGYAENWSVWKGNVFLDDRQMTEYLLPSDFDWSGIPVVVLISAATSSSGEVVAIAFKGRPDTWCIGESTAGFTTNVSWNPLSDRVTLQLSTSYFADRSGNVYSGTSVEPDEWIDGGDDFHNLLQDRKIIRALEWLRNR